VGHDRLGDLLLLFGKVLGRAFEGEWVTIDQEGRRGDWEEGVAGSISLCGICRCDVLGFGVSAWAGF
jgi:hypothetical protein